jgi:hypothetical protein
MAANLGGASHADKREDFMLAANQLMQEFPWRGVARFICRSGNKTVTNEHACSSAVERKQNEQTRDGLSIATAPRRKSRAMNVC